MLTLVSRDWQLQDIEKQAKIWHTRYPQLIGVCLNHNPQRTNAIFGSQTRLITGQSYLREMFAGLELQLRPDTFFQINTEVAEALLQVIIDQLDWHDNEVLIDAYCGIGTFTLPLARKVQKAIGIELHQKSIEQAKLNAKINNITNVTFHTGAVEKLLPRLNIQPNIILLDPPRKGCDLTVIDTLLTVQPQRIVYISCKPATLARDLKLLCSTNSYELISLQPADFFPQTAHVECAAFLRRL